MTANEDPGAGGEAAGPDRPSDDLEDWLSDLRTEAGTDPSGWIDEDPVDDDQPAPARGADDAEPRPVGRHRAPE